MLNAIRGVKLYAHCFSSGEALSSLLYMNFRALFIAMWNEASWLMLYKQ